MVQVQKYSILIVEDNPINIDVLVEALSETYEVIVATNGFKALEIMETHIPHLILLDVMMPEMDGHEVCRRIKTNKLIKHIPIIFLTALSSEEDEATGLELGAVDYITKPFNPSLVKARVYNHLQLKIYQDQLESLVKERTQELLLTQEVTIESLASLAEYRGPETGGHIERTKNYVMFLAEHLQRHPKFKDLIDDSFVDLMHISAPLHDIGKVGVKDDILLKPGKLTAEEWEEMKLHTLYGKNALEVAEEKLGHDSFLTFAKEIAYTHHERWDGSGYPQGLKSEAIPLSGRIMAIADVYDALISKRVYKDGMSHEQAVDVILKGDGRTSPEHFDPDLLEIFTEINDGFRKISLEYVD